MKLGPVPANEHKLVLAMGASFDEINYFIPDRLPPEPFIPWLPTSQTRRLTPIKLTIELVPEPCWFSNVRSHVSSMDWNTLKTATAQNAHYICQICRGKGEKWPVECHEIWEYDDQTHVQRLAGLISLCPPCHKVKHIGRSLKMGTGSQSIDHLAKINQWPLEKAENYVAMSFSLWKYRNQFEWKLDTSYLRRFGIHILNTDRNQEQQQVNIESKQLNNSSNDIQTITPKAQPDYVMKKTINKTLFALMGVMIISISMAALFYNSKHEVHSLANSEKKPPVPQKNKIARKSSYKKNSPNCQPYSHYELIDGSTVEIKGRACLDSQGRWRAIS